jgi:hypothetical protein
LLTLEGRTEDEILLILRPLEENCFHYSVEMT